MKLNKTFLTLGLAAALLQMPASSFAQNAGGSRQNPLLQKSCLPFGAPDFSKIQESDYLPAFEAAIKDQRANIQKIVSNKKKPTFQNTILAYENSGMLLDRVSNVFFGLTSAHKTPGIAETQKKVMPLLTNLETRFHSTRNSSSASNMFMTTNTRSSRVRTSDSPRSSIRVSSVQEPCFLQRRWSA